MFEEIFLESTRNVALRISVKIVETTANYYHLQTFGFKILAIVIENELVRQLMLLEL